MGNQLIVTVLEIEKGKKPNWLAAERKLAKITTRSLRKMPGFDNYFTGCANPLQTLKDNFAGVRRSWEGKRADAVQLEGAKTDMLIAAGDSWGDEIETVTEINMFIEFGLAKAAGFLVG